MKFTLHKKIFLDILTPIQAIIPPRTTLPILQNLKLSAQLKQSDQGAKLRFEATDLDVSFSRTLQAEVELEGSILVPAKRLYEIVRELPDLPVRVEQTDLTLTLSCERCVFKLPGIDVEDYPQMPTPAQDTGSEEDSPESTPVNSIKLKAFSLLRAIDKVAFAISTDESRPILCGVLWEVSEDGMKLIATDGHRLALMSTGSFAENPSENKHVSVGSKEPQEEDRSEASVGTPGVSEHSSSSKNPDSESTGRSANLSGSYGKVIIPQKGLQLLGLLLKPYSTTSSGKESELEVDIQFGEARMDFAFAFPETNSDGVSGSAFLSSRLISGIYPDYHSVLPKNNDKIIKASRDELIGAIRRVAVFSDPYTHLIKFSVDSGKIGLSASSPQGGEAYDEVECDYGGDGLEMGYNASYVLDVLRRIESEQIEIQLKSPVDAGIFLPTEEGEKEEIIYLLMPIRLLGQ